jgi:hypothetical protein
LQAQQGDKDAARLLGKQAQAALKRGDFTAARDLFEQAGRLYHAPTLLLGLARARAGLGQLVAAREAYKQMPRSLPADASPAFQKAVEAARQELLDLEARIPQLVLQIEGATDASVSLDGAPFPGTPGKPWPLDPGTHEVRATASGHLQTARFQAKEGEVTRVDLRVPPPDAPAAASASAAASVPVASSTPVASSAPGAHEAPSPALVSPEEQPRWLRPAGYAALGVGAAGLVASGVFGLVALSRRDTLLDRCGGTVCPEAERALHSDFRSSLRSANVAAAIGGVGLLIGVPLLLLAPGKPRQAALCVPGASVGLCGVF